MKVVNSCVENDMYLNNYFSKVVLSRRFPLSKYLNNLWHFIVLKGGIIKLPKDINYDLV